MMLVTIEYHSPDIKIYWYTILSVYMFIHSWQIFLSTQHVKLTIKIDALSKFPWWWCKINMFVKWASDIFDVILQTTGLGKYTKEIEYVRKKTQCNDRIVNLRFAICFFRWGKTSWMFNITFHNTKTLYQS